jgi:hypothetical protein
LRTQIPGDDAAGLRAGASGGITPGKGGVGRQGIADNHILGYFTSNHRPVNAVDKRAACLHRVEAGITLSQREAVAAANGGDGAGLSRAVVGVEDTGGVGDNGVVGQQTP